jgi:hypothetical protein
MLNLQPIGSPEAVRDIHFKSDHHHGRARPAIHVFNSGRNVDDRIKSGHDGLELNGHGNSSPPAEYAHRMAVR